MKSKTVELTEAEWTIIKTVWDLEPTTAPAVQQALHKITRWTYSTVRTLMDRMVGKGLLKAVKQGKSTEFRSAVTPEAAQAGELRYTLKNAFNGAVTPMVQCLLETQRLTEEDIEELEQLLRNRKRRKA